MAQEPGEGWPNMIHVAVRGPPPVLKRSNSLIRAGSTEGHLPLPEARPAGGRRSVSAERSQKPAWVSGPAPRARDREKFIPLPFITQEGAQLIPEEDELDLLEMRSEPSGSLSPLYSQAFLGNRGRIVVCAPCEMFNRELVFKTVQAALPDAKLSKLPEVIHLEASFEARRTSLDFLESGDIFIFDYGVLCLWGVDAQRQQEIMKLLVPCQIKPLSGAEVHTEELTFHYTVDQPPHIQNDCITISRHEARDYNVKMAISHALAQSCKLDLYESRVSTLVEQVGHLPASLAKHGEVRMSREQMARVKGQVFILKSEVYLLSTILDVPEFFGSAPDALRVLYGKIREYCELSNRVAIVNSRTLLIQTMLRVWSDHMSHRHLSRLDFFVVLLVVAEVIIAAAEVFGFFFHKTSGRG